MKTTRESRTFNDNNFWKSAAKTVFIINLHEARDNDGIYLHEARGKDHIYLHKEKRNDRI